MNILSFIQSHLNNEKRTLVWVRYVARRKKNKWIKTISQNSRFSMIKRRAKYYFEGQPRCYYTCFEIVVVKLAHIGHPGLVKTKSLLRSKLSVVAEQLDFAFLVSQFIKNQNHRQWNQQRCLKIYGLLRTFPGWQICINNDPWKIKIPCCSIYKQYKY